MPEDSSKGERPLMFTAFTSLNDGELEGKEVNSDGARALQCPLVVISVQFIWIVTQESLFQGEKKGYFPPLKYLLLKSKTIERSF